MNKKEIKDLLNTIEDQIPVEEYRGEGTSDGLCHYELDEDSWQYKTLEYIKKLQKNNRKLDERWNSLKNFINDSCFWDEDTMTYEDLIDEMNRLEDDIYE